MFAESSPITQALRAAQAVESMRARSSARFDARRSQQEARSASGLVSVSTTLKSGSALLNSAEHTIEIDPKKARVTRLRKGLGIAAKQLHNQGALNQQVWMQTLTYAGDNRDWRPEHITGYINALRRWHTARAGTSRVRYAWVAELQKRGVIHYHVIVWLNGNLTPPRPDTPWRRTDKRGTVHHEAPMWPHGMSNRLRSTAPVAYLMKYASKTDADNVGSFPHGARIHGAGGLDESGRCIRRWVLWPAYVQGNASVTDRFRPASGGGFINADTGEHLLAEFAPTGGGFSRFIRVRHTPRQIDPSGPYSWWNPEGATVH